MGIQTAASAIGGLCGVLFAVPILWGLRFLLPEGLQSYRIVIYGVLLIAIVLVKPDGLVTRPLIRRVTALFGRRPPGGRSAGAATERSA